MNDVIHPEIKSLYGEARPVDRRGFLLTSLGSGFALAVQPVSAQTITTPTRRTDRRRGQGEDEGRRDARLSRDAGDGREFPGTILVVQEIFGVHEHIKDVVPALREDRLLRDRAGALRRQGDVTKMSRHRRAASAKFVEQGAGRAGHERPRCDRRLREGAAARPTRRSSASPASAGAAASCGCTPRTIPR